MGSHLSCVAHYKLISDQGVLFHSRAMVTFPCVLCALCATIAEAMKPDEWELVVRRLIFLQVPKDAWHQMNRLQAISRVSLKSSE